MKNFNVFGPLLNVFRQEPSMTALGCLFCAKKADRFVSFRRTTEALKDRAGKNLSLELLVRPSQYLYQGL